MDRLARLLGPPAWCVLAAALFGASTPAAKALIPIVGPVLLSGLLYLGAALGVAPWALRGWARGRPTTRNNRLRLGGAVVAGGILGPLLLLWGLSIASAASVSLWLTMETVATAVLARLFFHEHIGKRLAVAVLLVIIASISLAGTDVTDWRAAGLVALAALAWGFDNSLTATIDGYTTAHITFVKGLGAAAVAIPVGLVIHGHGIGGQGLVLPIVGALLVGATGYGLSLILYVAAAQQLGATRSQLWFSTAPAFGLLVAVALMGEDVGVVHGFAAAAMGVGLWLLVAETHHHAHEHEGGEHRHWHRHDDGHHEHEHTESVSGTGWHEHVHRHERRAHAHSHRPDLHHRHGHGSAD